MSFSACLNRSHSAISIEDSLSPIIANIYTFSSQPGLLTSWSCASLAGQANHISWLKLVYRWLGYHQHTSEGRKSMLTTRFKGCWIQGNDSSSSQCALNEGRQKKALIAIDFWGKGAASFARFENELFKSKGKIHAGLGKVTVAVQRLRWWEAERLQSPMKRIERGCAWYTEVLYCEKWDGENW